MYRPISFTLLLTFLAVSTVMLPSVAVAQTGRTQEEKKAPVKEKSESMTGCIDEQEGHYILIDDRSRDPIASLEAVGFETEGFAKHVGHKVTVRGTVNPGGAHPLFRVRSIETVSETCGPQPAH